LTKAFIGRCLVVIALLGPSYGCDTVSKASRDPVPDRFELKQDVEGRVIRLNRVTGEVVVVQGTQLIPVRETKATTKPVGASRSQPTPKAVQPTKSAAPEVVLNSSSGPALPAASSSFVTTASAARRVAVPLGQQVTLNEGAPLFVTAQDNQKPLEVSSLGSFKVVAVEGDWYQVEFTDARWGRRLGFVRRRDVRASPAAAQHLEPVDLSIPELKRSDRQQLEPVDLSLPELRR
jgi:hypothetical protein